jgi:hypothetical protein
MKKLLWIMAIAAMMGGCYYDNEEQLYPKLDQSCDTTGVSFSKSVLPILQTNCYGCHSTSQSASNGNVDVEDFVHLKQVVGNGKFYGSIVHNPLNSPMPKGGAKLDTCSISKIKIWISKGALNN